MRREIVKIEYIVTVDVADEITNDQLVDHLQIITWMDDEVRVIGYSDVSNVEIITDHEE